MNEQIQQLLQQFAQANSMDPQQAQQFMAEFAQATPEQQQAFLQQITQQMQGEEQQPAQTEEEPMMQQGGNWSVTGYKQTSPDRHRPFNRIRGNDITMDSVDQALMLYGDGGEVIYAAPHSGEYHLPNSRSVLEIPMAQQGMGGEIPSRPGVKTVKPKPAAGKKPLKLSAKPATASVPAQPAGMATDEYLQKLRELGFDPMASIRQPDVQVAPRIYQTNPTPAQTPTAVAPVVIMPQAPGYSIPAPASPYKAKNPFQDNLMDYLPDMLKLMDAGQIEPGYLPHIDDNELQLQRINDLGVRQQLINASRGANSGIVDPHTQMGRAQAVQMNTNLLSALASVNAQYDTQNVGITNQERGYNNQQQQRNQLQNMAYNEQFYQQNLGSRDASRTGKFAALDGIAGKKAQAQKDMATYDAFQSAYTPSFGVDQNGRITKDPSKIVRWVNGSSMLSGPMGDGAYRTEEIRDAQGNVTGTRTVQEYGNRPVSGGKTGLKLPLKKQQGGKLKLMKK